MTSSKLILLSKQLQGGTNFMAVRSCSSRDGKKGNDFPRKGKLPGKVEKVEGIDEKKLHRNAITSEDAEGNRFKSLKQQFIPPKKVNGEKGVDSKGFRNTQMKPNPKYASGRRAHGGNASGKTVRKASDEKDELGVKTTHKKSVISSLFKKGELSDRRIYRSLGDTEISTKESQLGMNSRADADGSLPNNSDLLFKVKPLGIFNPSKWPAASPSGTVPIPSSWLSELDDRLENAKHIPNNAFDEMINWTKEGVLWQYPIDNEQGMNEELDVPFYEHVFLEKHLAPFPKDGPVRRFMELVLLGLSKNPHLTVQEKIDHINWYVEYFEKKQPYVATEKLLADNTT